MITMAAWEIPFLKGNVSLHLWSPKARVKCSSTYKWIYIYIYVSIVFFGVISQPFGTFIFLLIEFYNPMSQKLGYYILYIIWDIYIYIYPCYIILPHTSTASLGWCQPSPRSPRSPPSSWSAASASGCDVTCYACSGCAPCFWVEGSWWISCMYNII